MSRRRLPYTTAHVRVIRHSWQEGKISGEVIASHYVWEFQWKFKEDELQVSPALGRALIQEPLGRFLEQQDYRLEPGGDYSFQIRSQF
ncbi:MAG: DUF3146 family protein [Thermosynechococcaceae cyanobacterium MS004]|nr:DUF3146 family protein [Thermosynechococcaceae cyanobacterium MS004]